MKEVWVSLTHSGSEPRTLIQRNRNKSEEKQSISGAIMKALYRIQIGQAFLREPLANYRVLQKWV